MGYSSTKLLLSADENTFFGVELSMGVFGRDEAPVLDNHIGVGNRSLFTISSTIDNYILTEFSISGYICFLNVYISLYMLCRYMSRPVMLYLGMNICVFLF